MNLNGIEPVNFSSEIKTIESVQYEQGNFAQWLIDKLGETNQQLKEADSALQELASGKSQNIHQTMLTFEQAKLSMQMMEQIRNRIFSAWQEFMKEQI